MLKITRTNTFEAAHSLPYAPAGHKCRRTHGHSYSLTCEITGNTDAHGWIIDTAQIDAVFMVIHAQLDHRTLNDVPGLESPTTENLAIWCWDRFHRSLGDSPRIHGIAITIQESPRSTAYYDGPTEN